MFDGPEYIQLDVYLPITENILYVAGHESGT